MAVIKKNKWKHRHLKQVKQQVHYKKTLELIAEYTREKQDEFPSSLCDTKTNINFISLSDFTKFVSSKINWKI